MTMMRASLLAVLLLAACATPPPPRSNIALNAAAPRSILIVPALNQSVNVTAAENFLSTMAAPFASRGYYVFPSYMVRKTMENEGLGDAGLVHDAPATRLGALFGCDAALYVVIERWQSQTIIFATTTTVDLNYQLKSCKTGETLWTHRRTESYSPQANSSSGNPLADLIAQAAISMIEKAAPSYMPLARQANFMAAQSMSQGASPGPYLTTAPQSAPR